MDAARISSRLEAFRQQMAEEGWDALLINDTANVRYLSGFTNRDSSLLLLRDVAYFLTDSRYTEQAARECPGFLIMDYRQNGDSLSVAAACLCRENHGARLGFEGKHISYALHSQLAAACQEQQVTLAEAAPLTEQLRLVKDETEAALLRQACAATDQVFAALLGKIKPGMTEKEVEWELTVLVHDQGCTHSFDPIVVSGLNGALPHGVAGDKVIYSGELVTMDFGCLYQGYHADMTRTVCLGRADEKTVKVYNTVLEANLRAEAAIHAGILCREADQVARGFIAEQGYGGYFGHGLGHGVGLDIHELPNLSPSSPGTLPAGCFVTVEPGIYIPGWGGVRIEDTVRVTENGMEQLFAAPKELLCL